MRQHGSLPKPLRMFFLVALALDIVGLAFEAYERFVLRYPWPYGNPLLPGWAKDLTIYMPFIPYLHTPRFFETIGDVCYEYPAALAPFYGFFLSLHKPVRDFEVTLVLLSVAAAAGFGLHLHRKGLSLSKSAFISGSALLLSYPAAFELKQGNMELFACILAGAGIWCFVRGRFYLAAACIGVAGSMKIFPFVYLGLLVAQRRYRALGVAVLAAIAVTIPSLLYIDPSLAVAWRGVLTGIAHYQRTISPMVLHPQTSFDHSIFAFVKVSYFTIRPREPASTTLATVHRYTEVAAIFGVVLFFMRIRHMPVINQVICLCVASLVLPPISYDYTLVNLYIPWAMLVCFAFDKQNLKTAGLTAAFVCLAIATSIQTELIHHGRSAEGQIKAIALCVLMAVALIYPFRDAQMDSPRAFH